MRTLQLSRDEQLCIDVTLVLTGYNILIQQLVALLEMQ
jgi:hypothetical protein